MSTYLKKAIKTPETDEREEMVQVNDDYAAEHVQVIAEGLDWWLSQLANYGSLFLGEGCTVPHGNKTN
jgi:sulfopropanediol 3-dehydrogenase